jgi:hypothetical protein
MMEIDKEVDLENANHPARSDESQQKVTLDTANKPLWMGHAVEYLFKIDGGDGWSQMVQIWVELECYLGYPDRDVSP